MPIKKIQTHLDEKSFAVTYKYSYAPNMMNGFHPIRRNAYDVEYICCNIWCYSNINSHISLFSGGLYSLM